MCCFLLWAARRGGKYIIVSAPWRRSSRSGLAEASTVNVRRTHISYDGEA